jgi:hypothetical protein
MQSHYDTATFALVNGRPVAAVYDLDGHFICVIIVESTAKLSDRHSFYDNITFLNSRSVDRSAMADC